MALLLLPDTKLIVLKHIYCYFTSLDLGVHLKVSESVHHSVTSNSL